MDYTKLVICEKCRGTGHVNGGNENSTWSKTCDDCRGIGFFRVPITNDDRIRAMSDEELVRMLTLGEGAFDCFKCRKVVDGECDTNCPERCLDWLQRPAEEGAP